MTTLGRIIRIALVLLLIGVFAVLYFILPPFSFPVSQVVEIRPGTTLGQAAQQFAEQGIIRSPRIFLRFAQLAGGTVAAGLYEFERPLSVRSIAERVVRGVYSLRPVKITIPEGWSNEQIAERLGQELPGFDTAAFLELAAPLSGQLFPDTYLFPERVTPGQVVGTMNNLFKRQTAKLGERIEESERSFAELLSMAALVEEEVSDPTQRRDVAGILWKRYDAEMHLQVDVATSTYEIIGLPERPIVNPSLDALEAVLEASSTPYWYYLSDPEGGIHFAKTFEAHKQNIARHLKSQ